MRLDSRLGCDGLLRHLLEALGAYMWVWIITWLGNVCLCKEENWRSKQEAKKKYCRDNSGATTFSNKGPL